MDILSEEFQWCGDVRVDFCGSEEPTYGSIGTMIMETADNKCFPKTWLVREGKRQKEARGVKGLRKLRWEEPEDINWLREKS